MDPDGNDVAVHAEGEATEEGHEDTHEDSHGESEEQNCHFHAGVEYALPDFLFRSTLLTIVTDIALAAGAKRSLAAFASASTMWDCELGRSS